MKVAILNGVNLNFLGIRETSIYGSDTLDQINEKIEKFCTDSNIEIEFYQSNIEGEIVNKIHSLHKSVDYIIINPGAYTHYSIAIRDAILAVGIKTIEVHLSNVDAREEFRKHSVISDIAVGKISGFGSFGYIMALEYIKQRGNI
ncbi:MAG: type II 3-dehydroquinate dehydratase [Fusobacteriaceae bacterium]